MLVSLAATFAIAGCGSASNDSGGAPKHGGTLRIASAFEPTTLDPTLGHSDVGCANIEPAIFGTLTELRPGSVKVQPGLAKSWHISADGLTYTFHLRRARFSNGAPVTSEDVVFSTNRVLDPKVSVFSPLRDFVDSVTASDSSTVVFHLKKRSPALPEFLSFEIQSIVPKAYFQKVGAKAFATHPIGSGPFKLASWQRGRQLTLTRNPLYWRNGLPYVDQAVVRFVSDDNARILLLRSGQIDVDDNVSYAQSAALDQDPNIKVTPQPVSANFAVMLNEGPPGALRPTAVRQALNYATPKDDIIRLALGGQARVSNSIIPRLANWSPEVPAYAYDVAKARDLIASSPTPDGFSMTIGVLAGDPAAAETGTILQEAWKKIGIKVALRQTDPNAAFIDSGKNRVDGMIWNPTQWASDIISEDETADIYLGKGFRFFTHYSNPRIDRLVADAKTEVDPQKRKRLWVEIQRLSMEDPPWVPIAYPSALPAMRNNVEGFSFLPTVMWRIEQTTVR